MALKASTFKWATNFTDYYKNGVTLKSRALKRWIKKKGFTQRFVAEQLGMNKKKFIRKLNNAIIGSLVDWNGEYWEARKQVELSLEQQKIKTLVDYMIETGTSEAEEGYRTFYLDELPETEQFVREHIADIQDELYTSGKVIEVDIDLEKYKTIGINFYLDYCTNLSDETIQEFYGDKENTDLNGVLDQSELGGAKTRFQNNVAAIRLVNKLYAEKRNPTEAEKKVLSQFVGWGGLSQAFDENNTQWKKEYAELIVFDLRSI